MAFPGPYIESGQLLLGLETSLSIVSRLLTWPSPRGENQTTHLKNVKGLSTPPPVAEWLVHGFWTTNGSPIYGAPCFSFLTGRRF